ncbi:hypothetical protein IE81DRAFT_311036 [Ceraceosorus guamensis]|uniref:Cyclase n=1 Tax=Ceraceosorus guamensis TaxID=1522189 RepID=A0A316W630_9BASI|nr:hypothetical protein IE81DRAFT_311036 [Ceraceosorus guamensis]PWN44191.1 hypothetical protein IE81DRAFT_311036 [Ceraceosorus guamensis]
MSADDDRQKQHGEHGHHEHRRRRAGLASALGAIVTRTSGSASSVPNFGRSYREHPEHPTKTAPHTQVHPDYEHAEKPSSTHTRHARAAPASSTITPETSTRRLAQIALQLGSATSTATQSLIRTSPAGSRRGEWRHLPAYKDLPTEGGYPGCAWSVWGKGDVLGTVNMLTPELVLRTSKEEVRTGVTIPLNWSFNKPELPLFGRCAVSHTTVTKSGPAVIDKRKAVKSALYSKGVFVEDRSDPSKPEEMPMADEEIHFNTQSGSQWDGFLHFGHLGLNCFYQGIKKSDIAWGKQDNSQAANSPLARPGIHHLANHGIVGRGVLLDVYGYLSEKNGGRAPYDPMTTRAITLSELQECARAQGVRFHKGDILLIRTGFIDRYNRSSFEERKRWSANPGQEQLAGVEQGEHVAEWIWNNHFAAVAGDAPAFESWPPRPEEQFLHETLLGMFGCPIGEMVDLEKLVAHCRLTRRWTFLFASWPQNLPGGIASPFNGSAVF